MDSDEKIIKEFSSGILTNLNNLSPKAQDLLVKSCENTLVKYPKTSLYYIKAKKALEIMKRKNYNSYNLRPRKKHKKKMYIADIGLLSWTQDSCFLDSVIMCLLLQPKNFIKKNMLQVSLEKRNKMLICGKNSSEDLINRKKVQEKFIELCDSINGLQNVYNCSEFRSSLVNCPNEEEFYFSGMRDAQEFLEYLFSIFPVDIIKWKSVTYGKKSSSSDIWKKTSENVNKMSPLWVITAEKLTSLKNDKTHNIEDLIHCSCENKLDTSFDKGYDLMKQESYIIDTTFLVIGVQHMSMNNRFVVRSIIPTEYITLRSNRILTLCGIVVWINSHYTAYVKFDNTFYHYNDAGPTLRKIGDYDMLINSNITPNPKTHGTLYFYSE